MLHDTHTCIRGLLSAALRHHAFKKHVHMHMQLAGAKSPAFKTILQSTIYILAGTSFFCQKLTTVLDYMPGQALSTHS